jgi:predicted ribosome-associated RNA-binding protein Tma20
MWTAQELNSISPAAVQKRIGFTISNTEVGNYLGNLTLTPHAIPTELRSKHILHAITKEFISQTHPKVTETEFTVPEEIYELCATDIEAILIVLDSYTLPDLCVIKKQNEEQPLAIIMQIHPLERVLHGICVFDYGLTEKQTIHLAPQELVRIPVPQHTELLVSLTVTTGKTALAQHTPIPIINSTLGLLLDTRDSDILIESSLQQAREYVAEWLESLDIRNDEV